MSRLPDRPPDLEVVCFGDAKTKGSTRSFVPRRKDGSLVTGADGRPVVVTKNDAGQPAESWAAIVAGAVGQKMVELGFRTVPPRVPVALELVFYRPRNAGHFGTGRNAGLLKDSAPAAPAVLPDVDKQVRLVLDSLKRVVWHDDGQVVVVLASKEFGTPARLELRLWTLPATVGDVAPVGLAGASSQSPLFAG